MKAIPCERFENYAAVAAAGYPVGAFYWADSYAEPSRIAAIAICVPVPDDWHVEQRLRMLRVYLEGESPPQETSWEWDGNEDRPSIKPSIGVRTPGEATHAFHGWLKDGVLEDIT